MSVEASNAAIAAQTNNAAAVKGPPLGSAPHTLRLVVLLFLNSLLVFLCTIVLPAHSVWRQAVKLRTTMEEGNVSSQHQSVHQLSEVAFAAVAGATLDARSATRNILVAFRLFFTVPNSDALVVRWIVDSMRAAAIVLLVSQVWFISRFKGWMDEAEAMERGDRDEVLKRRRISMGKQLEHVALTAFTIPPLAAVAYTLTVLCGAPFARTPLQTLTLAGYVTLLCALPAVHVFGTNEREWKGAFTWHIRVRSARLNVVSQSVGCTLIGFLVGSAGILLDWDKAWQTYPTPPILGACIGLLVGNTVAGFTYLFLAPSRTAGRVERKAISTSSSSSSKAKKNKNKNKRR